MRRNVLIKIILFLCVVVAGNLRSTFAQCACPEGWYVCDNGKKCCTGGGCPSAICGSCPGGWSTIKYEGQTLAYCDVTGKSCPGLCASCGANTIEPLQRDIPGIVWTDTNNNNRYERGKDIAWYRTGSNMKYQEKYKCISGGPFVRSTAAVKTLDDTNLRISPNAGDFFCSTPDFSTIYHGYFHPIYAMRGLWTNKDYYVSVKPPHGYSCSAVKWRRIWCNNRFCDEDAPPKSEYGTGCRFIFRPNRYRNEIDWQLVPDTTTPTTVTGTVYETTNSETCSNNGTLSLHGMTATLYNGLTIGKSAGVDPSNGTYAITARSNDTFDSICINGTLNDASNSYSLACVTATASTGIFTCTKGSGACATVCTPNTALKDNAEVRINFGFTRSNNDKWITVVDGDIYAESVSTYIAPEPLGEFSHNLVNSMRTKGYAFSENRINTQTNGSGIAESGGAAQNLNIGANTFESNWLNRFNLNPPKYALNEVPADNNFEGGKIYAYTAEQFSQVLSRGSYTITSPNEYETAIVYIIDTATINIENSFTSLYSGRKVLLLITAGNVVISSDISNAIAGFNIGSTSKIDLAIIALGSIKTESTYDPLTNKFDGPLLINGNLVSRQKVDLRRNLGPENNSRYPAEVVFFYPYLSNLIRKYALDNPDKFSYSGLENFDVQFNYAQ